jgi:hypothetical protein
MEERAGELLLVPLGLIEFVPHKGACQLHMIPFELSFG